MDSLTEHKIESIPPAPRLDLRSLHTGRRSEMTTAGSSTLPAGFPAASALLVGFLNANPKTAGASRRGA
jgi:hypothetical protein